MLPCTESITLGVESFWGTITSAMFATKHLDVISSMDLSHTCLLSSIFTPNSPAPCQITGGLNPGRHNDYDYYKKNYFITERGKERGRGRPVWKKVQICAKCMKKKKKKKGDRFVRKTCVTDEMKSSRTGRGNRMSKTRSLISIQWRLTWTNCENFRKNYAT